MHSHTLIETYEHEGVTVEIHQDEDPSDPRDWSNACVMYCWHPSYNLGDEQFTQREHSTIEEVFNFLVRERGAELIVPLFLLDHSGITMSAGEALRPGDLSREAVASRARFNGDEAGWDTSWVGFAYTSPETRKDCGVELEHAEECIRSEVKAYDDHLMGNVYGYVVDPEGEGESCWGFYPDEDPDPLTYVRSEANSIAEFVAEGRVKEARERAEWEARDVVTI